MKQFAGAVSPLASSVAVAFIAAAVAHDIVTLLFSVLPSFNVAAVEGALAESKPSFARQSAARSAIIILSAFHCDSFDGVELC